MKNKSNGYMNWEKRSKHYANKIYPELKAKARAFHEKNKEINHKIKLGIMKEPVDEGQYISELHADTLIGFDELGKKNND